MAEAGGGGAAVRVVIAADSAIVREGLRSLLGGSAVEVAGEATSAMELAERAGALAPAVVLADVRALDGVGLAALDAIRGAAPGAALIVLGTRGEPWTLVQALLHGAAGYLAQDISRKSLIAAVILAAEGHAVFDRATLQEAVEGMRAGRSPRTHPVAPASRLTSRERQVLALMTEGRSNREIAGALSLSVGTVRVHVCNILTKLDLTHRVQAAVWAAQHGLGAADPERVARRTLGAAWPLTVAEGESGAGG